MGVTPIPPITKSTSRSARPRWKALRGPSNSHVSPTSKASCISIEPPPPSAILRMAIR
ncbi:Uncharacterised protein [Mycobacterium tuberculosis]|nr:Uncharacterised protein [Mycobacterium tuberculosis]